MKSPGSGRMISAKDVAGLLNVSYSMINKYTDMGLLEVGARKSRFRLYDLEKTKIRLAMISKLLNEGYTLRVIVKLLKK